MSDSRVSGSDTRDIDITVQGANDLADLARRLRTAGRGDLRKALLKGIRAEAAPVVADLKSAVLSLQVKGVRGGGAKARREHRGGRGKDHGLRRTVASAIQVKITTSGFTTGVRIRVNRSKLPANQRNLPAYLNGGRWRHPVFGIRGAAWAEQVASPAPWWDQTIARHAPAIRSGMAGVLKDYAAQLETGT